MDPKPNYKDYYYVLGISPEATTQEIQDAYDDLHQKFGPHVSVGGQDPEMLIKTYREITQAYETLIDPAKRKEYDLVNLPHLQKGHLRSLWGKLTGVNIQDNLQKYELVDTKFDIEVSLKEAIKGTKKIILLDEQLPCQECLELKPIQRRQCQACRGTGYIRNEREETIEVPPKVHDKMEIRLAKRGRFDRRLGINADLVITIRLRRHSFFSVLGSDLACIVPVTIYEAVLGGELEVPTATGRAFMKIQPLTQPGRVYRLKGLGLAGGDLLVTVEVIIPHQLGNEELTLFRKLKDASTMKNPRTELFDKLKNIT